MVKNYQNGQKYQNSQKNFKTVENYQNSQKLSKYLKNQNLQIVKYPHTTPFKMYT